MLSDPLQERYFFLKLYLAVGEKSCEVKVSDSTDKEWSANHLVDPKAITRKTTGT